MIKHLDWLGRDVKPEPKRRKVKRKPLGDGVYVLCVAIAILAGAFMMGCATAGPSIPHDLQKAELCMRQGACFVIQAQNLHFDRAVVYVNGARIDDIEGLTTKYRPLFVPEARLVEGRCVYITVTFPVTGVRYGPERQCIRPGGFYTLSVDPQRHVWFTPWGAGQDVQ